MKRKTPLLLPSLLLTFLGVMNMPADQNRHIEFVPTRVGQQGTTVDVLIQGDFLDDPREIIFYRPGIQAIDIKRIEDLERPISLAHSRDAVQHQVSAKFIIAEDCPIGEHQFKMRTGDQLTTLSTFWVTPYPLHREQEPDYHNGKNDTSEKAEALPRETVTVFGKMDPKGMSDFDRYRVSRKKGERISVEVDSVRLTEKHYGESEFDLAIRIYNAADKLIAEVDDSALHIQDPILSILAPEDGDYFIEIRQSLYKRAGWVHYLAHIGDFERPLAVYPAGGPAGESTKVTLLGDPAGAAERKITFPGVARSGDFEYLEGAPSALPMRVSPYPNVLEGEDGTPKLPVALNGIISKTAETDRFRIVASKDQTYRVRVYARSLGTPLDPQIEIVHLESGEVETTGDDATHPERDFWATASSFLLPDLLDPSIVWTPEHDGEYELRIADMRGLGGPHFVYRTEIEPVENAIHTGIYARVIGNAECSKFTAITVPQDNRWTMNVRLYEGQGNLWKGDVRLVAHGLPEGIEMIAPVVPQNQSQVPVQFVALPGTEPQAGVFRIVAEPVEPGVELDSKCQQAMPFLSISSGRAWHTVIVDQYAYAVTDPAPFRLEVEPPEIPLSKNGELKVKVKLHREPGFTEPVEVNAYWAPLHVTAQPAARFEEGETELEYSFQAGAHAVPKTWKVALQATTLRGTYFNGVGDIRVSSPFFDLKIAEPYVELRSQPIAIRRQASGEFTFEVTHKNPFEGDAEATLLGLPKGVTAEPAKLRTGDEKLTFKIQASQEALLGQYSQIGCEITVHEGEQIIRQRSGNGILRVDPALESN